MQCEEAEAQIGSPSGPLPTVISSRDDLDEKDSEEETEETEDEEDEDDNFNMDAGLPAFAAPPRPPPTARCVSAQLLLGFCSVSARFCSLFTSLF